jgi:NAD-reducing hydrogenase small subunit
MNAKVRVATVWLSGCSGCHMSFLDLDERLIDLAQKIQLVYSPIADIKKFPENVDATLIEGALANDHQVEVLKTARANSKILISLGDCAVTGNVTALRNPWARSDKEIIDRAYLDPTLLHPQEPTDVPRLLVKARPLHEEVKVDYFIPGCPPSADLIYYVLSELLAGRTPKMEGRSKYG